MIHHNFATCEVFQVQKEKAEYEAKYPDHCRKCRGGGYIVFYQNHGPFWGGGDAIETMIDPCEECHPYCPRCRQEQLWSDEEEDWLEPCPSCGWDKSGSGMCPDPGDVAPCSCVYPEV